MAQSLREVAEVSRHAVPFTLMLSAALVGGACQSDPPITVEDGQVKQISELVSYRGRPPRDVILAVNATADDAPFRQEVRTALSSAMNDLHAPGGRWDAVDVQAWVVDVATHAIVGPSDDPRLVSCKGCGSGYCVPDQAQCRGLRFVGGAASDTLLEIVCNQL